MASDKNGSVEERIRVTISGLRPLLRLSDPPTIDLVSFDARNGLAMLRCAAAARLRCRSRATHAGHRGASEAASARDP